jgi:glycogen operon protein
MEDEHWDEATANVLGIFVNGEGIATPDDRGRRIVDDTFYLMFNAGHETTKFRFPDARWGAAWSLVFDTARGFVAPAHALALKAGGEVLLEARTLAAWQR